MKANSLLCTWAGAGLLLSSCATEPPLRRVEAGSSKRPDKSLTEGILRGVNEVRRADGLATLRRHPGLDRLAQQHSEFMMANRGRFRVHGKNISHDGFEGRVMVARHRYNMETISENVIAGTRISGDIAAVLVRGWSSSGGHRKNMMDDWSVTGIGVAVDEDGGVFATQLFGVPNLTHSRWAGPSQGW